MRWHLLKHFSYIYILNLHGDSVYREVHPPNIQIDQNVFDIQQGTSIAIFVREENHLEDAQVFYADLWGERDVKYNYLATSNVNSTQWTQLYPKAPYYRFVEKISSSFTASYDQWPSITSLLPKYTMGIVTGRDSEVYDYEETSLKARFAKPFQDSEIDILQATYRPFDTRWLAYGPGTVTRRREDIMRHILRRNNLALVTFRHTRRSTEMRTFVSRYIVDARLLSSESNCFVFPLYLYANRIFASGMLQMNTIDETDYVPNFASKLMNGLSAQYGVTLIPEEVFYYLYGILNAPGYQSEFEGNLHQDFPRIPFTSSYDAFKEMSERGKRIMELHLCEADDLQGLANLEVGYQRTGTNLVEPLYPTFDALNGYVHINSIQYFEGISQDMWDYKVGSYTPLRKWLADRRGHILGGVERRHYESFATSIKKVLLEFPEVEAAWQMILSSNWFNPLI